MIMPKLIYTVTLCSKEAHPECNSRVAALLDALDKMHLTPKFRPSEIVQLQNHKTATLQDVAAVRSAQAMETVSEETVDGSGDTYATDTTFKESLVAAGAGLSLVDYVVTSAKTTKNPPVGFALICSPGHHAVPDGPTRPCFTGNVAIAARYAQRTHGLKRVLIIDFDAHHAKGTHDVFYDDPDVFFLSIHQDGITGKIDEIGRENGVGATLNMPLPGLSGDLAMLGVFNSVIRPCAEKFKPDIILVSAGYNGHVQDESSSLQFRTMTYNLLASGIKKLATELCDGRCVFFLKGGGDNLESFSDSVAESFRAFIGEPSKSVELDIPHFVIQEPIFRLKEVFQKIKQLHHL